MVTTAENTEPKETSHRDNGNEISDPVKQIFNCIAESNFDEVKSIFEKHKLPIDVYDEDSMTPLQHACYKGNLEMVEYFIQKGADVNNTRHKCQFTALHFAAVSGKPEICLALLEAGADSHITNTIGRTASQLAGFVANHHCASVINNYVRKSDVEYFTVPRGTDTKPKLLPVLSIPLYTYIMEINLHPVRLAVKMPAILVKEYSQIKTVLALMCEREMKKGMEANEVLAFKYHYLGFILSEIHKNVSPEKEITDSVETFVKKILRVPRGEEYLNNLLKECVREFPFKNGLLFQQIVKSLTRKNDAPSALNVILSATNSLIAFNESPCATCTEPKAVKKCSKCKAVQYCDRECQRLHWFVHKKECARSSTTVSKEKLTEDDMKEVSNVLNDFKM